MDLSVNKIIKTPNVKEVLSAPFINSFKDDKGYLTIIGESRADNTLSFIVDELTLEHNIPLSSIFYVENEIDSIMLMQIINSPDIEDKRLVVIDDENSRPTVSLLYKLLNKNISVIVRVEPKVNLVEQFLDSTGCFCRKVDLRTLYGLIPFLFSIIADLGDILLELALYKKSSINKKGRFLSCIEAYQVTY